MEHTFPTATPTHPGDRSHSTPAAVAPNERQGEENFRWQSELGCSQLQPGLGACVPWCSPCEMPIHSGGDFAARFSVRGGAVHP